MHFTVAKGRLIHFYNLHIIAGIFLNIPDCPGRFPKSDGLCEDPGHIYLFCVNELDCLLKFPGTGARAADVDFLACDQVGWD
jgi:hypothetical protein